MYVVFSFLLLLFRQFPGDDETKNKGLSYFVRPGMTRQQVEAILVGPGCSLGGVGSPQGYPLCYPGVLVVYSWPIRGDASFRVLHVYSGGTLP